MSKDSINNSSKKYEKIKRQYKAKDIIIFLLLLIPTLAILIKINFLKKKKNGYTKSSATNNVKSLHLIIQSCAIFGKILNTINFWG